MLKIQDVSKRSTHFEITVLWNWVNLFKTPCTLHVWCCITQSPQCFHYSAQDFPSHHSPLQFTPCQYIPAMRSGRKSEAGGWALCPHVSNSLSPVAVKMPISGSFDSSLGTKLWWLQRESTSLLFQTGSHADVKILLCHNWTGLGLKQWKSLILLINCYCLSSGNVIHIVATSIYILALS